MVENQEKQGRSGIKEVFKKLTYIITGGVIGSALSISVLLNTDLLSETNHTPAIPSANAEMNDNENSSSFVLPSLADMVEEASKAVVGVVSTKQGSSSPWNFSRGSNTSSGSGVVFKKEGKYAYIVTNNHVIEGANQIEVSLENGEKVEADLVGADALTDLAVLKIDGNHVDTVMKFGDSDALRAGDFVVAIGNPLGLEFSRTVTQGIVSAVNRTVSVQTSAGQWDLNVIQTDAAINPGNSGGALVNLKGELVGINSLKIAESGVEGLGFAIPANEAKPLIEEILEKGKIERPYIGIGMIDVTQLSPHYLQQLPEDKRKGVIITSVEKNSPADKAGLQIEDILFAINGKEINNSNELRKYLYTELKVGDKASLQIYRNGKVELVFITLTEYPDI